MKHWLYPANTKFYDVLSAFKYSNVYWPMNSRVLVNDVVYIYLSAPHKQIAYVCEVKEVGLELNNILDHILPYIQGEIDNKKPQKLFMKLRVSLSLTLEPDSLLAYQCLKLNGLKGMLMGSRKLENNPELLNYIRKNLS